MDWSGIRGKISCPSRDQEPSVAQERMSATEKIEIRRMDVNQLPIRVSTIETPSMIKLIRERTISIVIVAAK
jgi:hypothetical protein